MADLYGPLQQEILRRTRAEHENARLRAALDAVRRVVEAALAPDVPVPDDCGIVPISRRRRRGRAT